MSSISRISGVAFVLALLLGGPAAAATTADQLVALARAGLDDDVLIALIQTDGSVFQLTADDILALHQQGLSSRVIRAMQDTGRPPGPECAAPPAGLDAGVESGAGWIGTPEAIAPRATAVSADRAFAQPIIEETAVPVPVAVPVYVRTPVAPRKPAEPVYWGWGGERRPDSWEPTSSSRTASHDRPAAHQPAASSDRATPKDRSASHDRTAPPPDAKEKGTRNR